MGIDASAKKFGYIGDVVAQAQKLKEANDTLRTLLEKYQNQFGPNQSLQLNDLDFTGQFSYMTAANMTQFFSSVQPPVDTAIRNGLQALLTVLQK